MKKLTLSGIIAASVLLMTACSEDNTFRQQPSAEGNVTFNVTLPADLGSRAFADGYSATTLQYAVYESSSDATADGTFISEGSASFDSDKLTTTVSLQLANGKAYKIAFFAHNGADVYAFNAQAKTVTVDYTKMTEYNSTDYDCFYGTYTTPVVTGPISENVTIYRPVAQINWGTSDLAVYNNAYGDAAASLTTKVDVKGVNNVLNLFDGSRSGDVTVNFPALAAPEGETFPVKKHDYLSMNYVLVPAESSIVEATLTPNNGSADMTAVVVANMPVQANYRTNVYGALLTSPTDFTVTKEENFGGDDYNYPIEQTWQGDVVKPAIPADNTINISSANEFAGLAKMIQDGDTDFEGVTINLTEDLDLNGIEFTPIGSYPASGNESSDPAKPFKGVFNGNHHKITNLNSGHKGTAALFGYVMGQAQINDLTIENVKLDGSRYAGGVAALLHQGSGEPVNPTIKNVTVRNAEISAEKKCGGITGFFQSNVIIEGCKVEHCVLTATEKEVGGLFGSGTYGGANATRLKDNSVSDCTIYINGSSLNTAGLLSGGLTGSTTPNDQKVIAYNTNNTATNTRIIATAAETNALKAALAAASDGLEIMLAEGAFDTKGITWPNNKTFTITGKGADKTALTNLSDNTNAAGCDFTFNDLSLNVEENAYTGTCMGFIHIAKATFNNVTFNGEYHNYATESETYNNCAFVYNAKSDPKQGGRYAIWCYGCRNSIFNDCTFDNTLSAKAILVYGVEDTYNRNVTVKNCTFRADGATDKGAVEIHTELFKNYAGTITIENSSCSETFEAGIWNEVNNNKPATKTEFFTIIVDGETVQQGSRQ